MLTDYVIYAPPNFQFGFKKEQNKTKIKNLAVFVKESFILKNPLLTLARRCKQ